MNAHPLRTLRKARGLTQVQLARAAGVHPVMLSRIETGTTRHPRVPTLFRLARALKVEPALLLGSDADVQPRIQRRKPRTRGAATPVRRGRR